LQPNRRGNTLDSALPRLSQVWDRKIMPKPSPSLYAAAALIWLRRGELPDIGGF
jgi:hypothetical protein